MNRIFSILLTLAALGFGLAACEQNPNSSEQSVNFMEQPAAAPSSIKPDAHPALLLDCWDRVYIKGKGYDVHRISVCDIDETDRTPIYTPELPGTYNAFGSKWSPSGASVSFIEGTNHAVGEGGPSYIKAVDVSVPTLGKTAGIPQASNLRTITSTSDKIRWQDWVASASGDFIAYMTESMSEYAIYTIPVSGGSPTKIYSLAISNGSISSLSWSPDGTQFAVTEKNGSTWAIKLISRSGTVNTTLVSGIYQSITGVKWSNTGTNQIAYIAVPAGITPGYNGWLGESLYLIGTASGSTPTVVKEGLTESDHLVSYRRPLWSPDNSEILIWRLEFATGTSPNSSEYKFNLSTGVQTPPFVFLNAVPSDWKQPS